MISFLDTTIDLSNFSCDGELQPVFDAAKFAIRVIQIAVPFALVIWGSLDWFKALIASDEKEMRVKRKPFIARVIAAIIVLVLPMLVETIARSIVGQNETDNFWKCYVNAYPKLDFSKWQNSNKGSSSGSSSNSSTQPKSNKKSCGSYSIATCPYPGVAEDGTPCTIGPTNGGNSVGCIENTNAKKCSQIRNQDECVTDDYGNACEWYFKTPKETGGSTPEYGCKEK